VHERFKGELDSFPLVPYGRQLFVDKSSWLSLSNRSSGGAQWRAATCRLAEEEEGCQLNIYVEVCRFSVGSSSRLKSEGSPSISNQEAFLHQAVYIYLLKATDIRPADRSLFDRKDVLAIHTVPCVSIALPSSGVHG